MTAPRVVSIIAALGISAGLYAFLDQARNDVAFKTRSVMKQSQKAEADAEADLRASSSGDADAYLRINERLARRQQRMFMHLHHPERVPDEEMTKFDALWPLLNEGSLDSVHYAESQPKSDPASRKRVVFTSRDRRGEAMPVTLEWVRYRGSWYIEDFRQSDRREASAAD